MAQITGAELVVDALKREGIDTVYTLPGDPVGPIVNGCAEAGLRVISVRHEQAAAMAAQAHSYFTRGVGVCIAASGVGQTNTLTAIANAQVNCWPLLVIGGSAELRRRNMGDFQELAQVESTAPLCKWSYAAESIQRIPTLINIALRRSVAGRPGPVYLDLPAEMISGSVDDSEVEIPAPAPEPARPLAEPDKIEKALEVLKDAERPLLIVGKGASWSWAEDELLQFVERTQIPFLTSPMGAGTLPPDHPMNVSAARTQALQGADTILLVGARLNWIFHFGQSPRFAEDYKLIQVDIDDEEIGTNHPAEVGLVGDAKMVMGQMVDALDDNPVEYGETPWLGGLKEKSAQNAATIEPMLNADIMPLGYYRILKEIRDYLPKDSILVADGASTMDISRQVIPVWNPRQRVDAGVAGCVGVGVPFSIAAKVVYPDKPVICLQGDWAFGFNGMDIETAVRFKLPIVWVVFQNANIDKWVREYVDGEDNPNDFTPAMRFDLMMEAFGGHGEYVEKPDEIRPALERRIQLRQGRAGERHNGPGCKPTSSAVRVAGPRGTDGILESTSGGQAKRLYTPVLVPQPIRGNSGRPFRRCCRVAGVVWGPDPATLQLPGCCNSHCKCASPADRRTPGCLIQRLSGPRPADRRSTHRISRQVEMLQFRCPAGRRRTAAQFRLILLLSHRGSPLCRLHRLRAYRLERESGGRVRR